MNLDEQYEQHLGTTCAEMHGKAHHDDWLEVKSSSTGIKFSTRFTEYWTGISDAQRMSQHQGIPCDEFHSKKAVQGHYRSVTMRAAASMYDTSYGMHAPYSCTATHKGMSHDDWMSREKYLDWRGQSYWGDVTGVLSHEEWLIHGMWTYHQSLDVDARRRDKAKLKAKQDKTRKDEAVVKFVGIGLGLLLVIFVIWQFRSTEPTGDIGDSERWYGDFSD